MSTRIALVIKWIENPESVSREELINNGNAAISESPLVAHSLITQAAVAAADSVVAAARITDKVANRKLSRHAYNRAVKCVDAYLAIK